MKPVEKKSCGSCCWFKHEDEDGWGICYHKSVSILECSRNCATAACGDYTGIAEYRRHIAVLIRANRYRRDKHVPASHRMPNPADFGRAIDFAVEYMKAFERI